MPYKVTRNTDRCSVEKPFAVVNEINDRLHGCHPSEAAARQQAEALYAKEGKEMRHLELLEAKATVTDQGVFSALFATYDTDRMNERIAPGAFADTITTWQKSGKRIPLHWEHSARPEDIVGYIDPNSMRETAAGVYVEGKLDLEESSTAREVWRSMRNDAIGLSFGYLVQDEATDGDGTKELKQLDLFEITVTAKPVNADTRVLSMKGFEDMRGVTDVLEQSGNGGNILIVDPESLFVKASTAAWDGSPGRFTDEQYARSCILDRAKCSDEGRNLPAKQRYSLPIREPGGGVNKNAVHAAAARINQVDACPAAIASAKNALKRAYGELGEEAPDNLKGLTEDEARAELGFGKRERRAEPVRVAEAPPKALSLEEFEALPIGTRVVLEAEGEAVDGEVIVKPSPLTGNIKTYIRDRSGSDYDPVGGTVTLRKTVQQRAVTEKLGGYRYAAETEDEDAGEEPHGQPRAQDPLKEEVERDLMEMRLRHARVFNPLTEE